jgi:hypothetical protein
MNEAQRETLASFRRFSISGFFFTILGPLMFWLIYPLGAIQAVVISEGTLHTIRFMTFRRFIFPAHKGYNVTKTRYVMACMPITAMSITLVALLSHRLDRATLTLTTSTITIIAGFLWSRYVYKYF